MNEQRIKEVFSDEEFVKSLLELEGTADVQAALNEKGIEMTGDEIIQLRDEINKAAEKAGDGGELSLDQLDEAAGGVFSLIGLAIIVACAAAATAGGYANAKLRLRW